MQAGTTTGPAGKVPTPFEQISKRRYTSASFACGDVHKQKSSTAAVAFLKQPVRSFSNKIEVLFSYKQAILKHGTPLDSNKECACPSRRDWYPDKEAKSVFSAANLKRKQTWGRFTAVKSDRSSVQR